MHKIFSIIVLILACNASHAETVEYDSLFAVANQSYENNDFEKSFRIYDGLVKEGLSAYNLFYNYANACLKTNRPAKAIAYYKKSLRIQPKSAEAQKNLDYTLQLLEINEIDDTFFIQKWHEEYLYILTGVLVFVLLILFLLRRQNVIQSSKTFRVVIGFNVLCALFFIFQSAVSFDHKHLKTFAVVQKETVVYQQPFYLSQEVYELNEGQTIRVLNTQNGWSKILTGNHKKAWVPADLLIEI